MCPPPRLLTQMEKLDCAPMPGPGAGGDACWISGVRVGVEAQGAGRVWGAGCPPEEGTNKRAQRRPCLPALSFCLHPLPLPFDPTPHVCGSGRNFRPARRGLLVQPGAVWQPSGRWRPRMHLAPPSTHRSGRTRTFGVNPWPGWVSPVHRQEGTMDRVACAATAARRLWGQSGAKGLCLSVLRCRHCLASPGGVIGPAIASHRGPGQPGQAARRGASGRGATRRNVARGRDGRVRVAAID